MGRVGLVRRPDQVNRNLGYYGGLPEYNALLITRQHATEPLMGNREGIRVITLAVPHAAPQDLPSTQLISRWFSFQMVLYDLCRSFKLAVILESLYTEVDELLTSDKENSLLFVLFS